MNVEQAVVLVGGRGTRLRSMTTDTPKPLLQVGGRPFLDYIVAQLEGFGIKRILCLAGFEGGKVSAWSIEAARSGNWSARIDVMIEDEPMGTGGALVNAVDQLDEVFLLLNGDSLFLFQLDEFVASFFPDPGAASIALYRTEDCSRYGRVEVAGSQVSEFKEKSLDPAPGLVNSGVYLFSKVALPLAKKEPSSLEKDTLPLLANQGRLGASIHSGFFIDIGVPESFAAAQSEVPLAMDAFFKKDG